MSGQNPNLAGDAVLPQIGKDGSGHTPTFIRSSTPLGPLTVKAQMSDDLENWLSANDIANGLDTGSSDLGVTITDQGATDQVQIVLPAATPRRFARIHISQP